jgi:hypothetical protein
MAEKIRHKRGDTFKIAVIVTEDDGDTRYDLTGWTVRSHIRKSGKLIAELVFGEIDISNGEFSLMVMDTDNWPMGKLESDIEYIDAMGYSHSTETYVIEVIKDVTYD